VSGRVCAFADGVMPGQRLLLEYRSRDGWDRGMPQRGAGWVVAHLTGPGDGSAMSLQIVAVEATEGASIVTPKGTVRLSVGMASSTGVTLTAEVMAPVPVDRAAPAVASWGKDRIDIFGRGLDRAAFHKAWAQAWFPSLVAWEALDGGFTGPLAVLSWGPDRLDIFGIGLDQAMWHKAWAQAWHPGQTAWEPNCGRFLSPPAVASWGPERLDIFALGLDQAVWHKAWAQRWHPSQNDWEPLGGKFISRPAVASWGPGRLDIFGVGLDKAMFHKAWDNGWHPSPVGWEFLGGGFTSPPAVCSWGPDRLDIFALGLDQAVWHKAWAQRWHPSQNDWEPLGGKFIGPPAVASWGPGRIDILALAWTAPCTTRPGTMAGIPRPQGGRTWTGSSRAHLRSCHGDRSGSTSLPWARILASGTKPGRSDGIQRKSDGSRSAADSFRRGQSPTAGNTRSERVLVTSAFRERWTSSPQEIFRPQLRYRDTYKAEAAPVPGWSVTPAGVVSNAARKSSKLTGSRPDNCIWHSVDGGLPSAAAFLHGNNILPSAKGQSEILQVPDEQAASTGRFGTLLAHCGVAHPARAKNNVFPAQSPWCVACSIAGYIYGILKYALAK
jgi:hypothetical protein